MSATDAEHRRSRERKHALHAIDWLEVALHAVEQSDYQASDHAIGVARMHIKDAEDASHERNDR